MKKNKQYLFNPNLEFIIPNIKGNETYRNRFINPDRRKAIPVKDLLRWKLTENPQKQEKKRDKFKLDIKQDLSFLTNNRDVIIWLGHSSFYIRLDNTVYMTDPNFSDMPFYKRLAKLPLTIQQLGKIDYILISHGHYDHCDKKSINKIIKHNPNVELLLPLRLTQIFQAAKYQNIKMQDAAWYQIYQTPQHQVTFLPVNHWHNRTMIDLNKALWGSFAIVTDKYKVFFAGDTAADNEMFNSIQQIYQYFDYCLLPIGAYSPDYMMKHHHINPKEALAIFKILHGKHFIPMHYATYNLADEPRGEPIHKIQQYMQADNLQDQLVQLSISENYYLSS